MAPSSHKWTPDADMDLILAMITAQENVKPGWLKVKLIMSALGHHPSEGACAQRFNKTIAREFEDRLPPGFLESLQKAATPTKRKRHFDSVDLDFEASCTDQRSSPVNSMAMMIRPSIETPAISSPKKPSTVKRFKHNSTSTVRYLDSAEPTFLSPGLSGLSSSVYTYQKDSSPFKSSFHTHLHPNSLNQGNAAPQNFSTSSKPNVKNGAKLDIAFIPNEEITEQGVHVEAVRKAFDPSQFPGAVIPSKSNLDNAAFKNQEWPPAFTANGASQYPELSTSGSHQCGIGIPGSSSVDVTNMLGQNLVDGAVQDSQGEDLSIFLALTHEHQMKSEEKTTKWLNNIPVCAAIPGLFTELDGSNIGNSKRHDDLKKDESVEHIRKDLREAADVHNAMTLSEYANLSYDHGNNVSNIDPHLSNSTMQANPAVPSTVDNNAMEVGLRGRTHTNVQENGTMTPQAIQMTFSSAEVLNLSGISARSGFGNCPNFSYPNISKPTLSGSEYGNSTLNTGQWIQSAPTPARPESQNNSQFHGTRQPVEFGTNHVNLQSSQHNHQLAVNNYYRPTQSSCWPNIEFQTASNVARPIDPSHIAQLHPGLDDILTRNGMGRDGPK